MMYSLLLSAALVPGFAPSLQQPGGAPVEPVGGQSIAGQAVKSQAAAQQDSNPIGVGVVGGGAIEAPQQPRGRSSSTFRRTPRVEPDLGRPSMGRISTPVGSLVATRGVEDNVVWGVGIVDGLAGTGDSGGLALQLLQNVLLNQNITVDQGALASGNVAVVRVEAEIPAGVKPGRRIDVRVSSIGDAESLLGGNLILTELTDITGNTVYATAAGPLTVGGFTASGEAATTTKNHNTVGVLSKGGKIQREVPTRLVSEHGFIYLDSRLGQDSLGNVVRIAESVNALYPELAHVLPDGKTVRVEVPADLPDTQHVAFLDSILKLEVESDNLARVIVNERTGVIVMGGDVRLRPGVVGHGSLVVTIAETPQASQPGPLSNGETVNLDRTDLGVVEENNGLVMVPGAVTLQEVVDVLNVLGATPRDMIAILTAMSEGGLLVAEIRRM